MGVYQVLYTGHGITEAEASAIGIGIAWCCYAAWAGWYTVLLAQQTARRKSPTRSDIRDAPSAWVRN